MNKTILLLIPSLGFGGCEIYAFEIAMALKGKGDNVIVAFHHNIHNNILLEHFNNEGFKCIKLIHNHSGDTFRSPLSLFLKIIEIIRLLLKVKPDAAHLSLHWPTTGFSMIVALGLLKIRTVLVFQLMPNNFKLSWLRILIYKILKQRNQVWVVLTNFSARIISNKFKVNINSLKFIPNGVDGSKFKFKKRSFEYAKGFINIVSVGRLSYQKGYDMLIPVLAKLKDYKWNLVIYGEGEERENLESLIYKYGLDSRVSLIGSSKYIYEELHKYDLFVLPTRYEGFPFALIEAVFNGLPIITSNVSGIDEVIKDNYNGLVFERDDSNDLLEKIRFALENQSYLEFLVKNGINIRHTFTKRKMINSTIKLIHAKYSTY